MQPVLAIRRMIKTLLQVYPIFNIIRMFLNLLVFSKFGRASRSCQDRFMLRALWRSFLRANVRYDF